MTTPLPTESAHDDAQAGTNMSPPTSVDVPDLRDQIAALAAECKKLSDTHERLTKKLSEKGEKDFWDRLGLSGPLFLGAIGLLLTGVLHCDSTRRADIQRNANERTQDLQSFSLFLPHLASLDSAGQGFTPGDSIRQELAIRALRNLGSCDLAGLAAGLYPTPGTRAGLQGLLELKRPESISERDDCGFADTVYQRVFLDTGGLKPVLSPDALPQGVSPPETITARQLKETQHNPPLIRNGRYPPH